MQLNNENEQIDTSNEIDNIIMNMLIPVTNKLLIKTKELKEKKLEFRRELNDMRHLKQALIQKRKRLIKQKTINERNLNGDLSNTKICEELLINYINYVDKKESEFIKSKEDFYELKLRKKRLIFNLNLIEIIMEKSKLEKRKKFAKNNSFDDIKKLDISSNSLSKTIKNINKSFSMDKSNNKSLTKTITTVTPIKTDMNSSQKNNKKKNSYMRNKSNENNKMNGKNKANISREIESLINNYSSKKKNVKTYNSESFDNFNEGLNQMKEINKETKEMEKELKEMMNSLLIDENE